MIDKTKFNKSLYQALFPIAEYTTYYLQRYIFSCCRNTNNERTCSSCVKHFDNNLLKNNKEIVNHSNEAQKTGFS